MNSINSAYSAGYKESYFDIDDIIATQQRIPCQFKQQVHNLGELNTDVETRHPESGSIKMDR